jgi:hypothetical protein
VDILSRERAQASASSAIEVQPRVIGRPWPKGVSGNPGGVPKVPRKPITDLCEEIINHPETREKIKQQVIATLTSRGMAGVLLLREIGERVEGKVTQGIELSGSVNAMSDDEIMDKMASLLDVKINEPERLPEPTQTETK